MKKYFLFAIVSLLLVVTPTFAQSTTPNAVHLEKQETRITNLKNRADTEIERRITSLTTVMNTLSSAKHLSQTEITTLSTNIQTEINNLTTLKTKIDADTDITTLRVDVQSIVKAYRVYLLFLPQTRILATSNKIIDIVSLFNTPTTGLISKLQSRLTGNTTAALQSAFSDLQAKVADAQTQAQNAITTVTPLTPTGYPGNESSLQSARTMLKTARQDLLLGREDVRTIMQGLRATTPIPTQ